MTNKKTLVLGASENPSRYGNMALKRLRANGHDVVAIGRREGQVGDVVIHKAKPEEEGVDTVTMYMNEQNQKEYEDYILSLKPRRIIFNPGAENEELAGKAAEQGIQTMEACTLVLLSTGQY
ncbi:CoA-binding protein [Niabella sp. W65]|nr:CoA-binding protein [Niabella sp. W65]MCH7362393.1 CoA-binding protein [Niabella sp. W65]ULT38360.1 CoA-binding protein [Niabella sp. I65]